MATPKINHLSFNQDYTCFSAALDTGFCISQIDPFRTIKPIARGSPGGVRLVALLFRCCHLCLVGGGPDPLYSPRDVMIWNNVESRFIGQISSRSEVKNVKFRRDNVVVVTLQKINVYKFPDLRLMNQIDTDLNPNGLCEISYTQSTMVLVCPGLRKGEIRVENFGSRKSKFILAHDSSIACMTMTPDGKILATASSKGTLIRVFNTLDGSLLQEVRRGAERAEIFSLAFSSNAQWLAVSSDKGTVHVFGLKVDLGSLAASNHSNAFGISSLFKGVVPKYFNTEWSVARFRLPKGLKNIVGFGHQKNTIVIISMDGSFYRCEFDPVTGGEMTQLEHINFLNPRESLTPSV